MTGGGASSSPVSIFGINQDLGYWSALPLTVEPIKDWGTGLRPL